MVTLIVSSRNAHKLGEIRAILGTNFTCIGLDRFPSAPAVLEDASTFEGNATKKSVELARWLSSHPREILGKDGDCYVLADDSGLEVDALNGAPGVHSARFAALSPSSNSTDALNNEKLLCLLKDIPGEKRTARFRCVIALTPLCAEMERGVSPPCSADGFELQTTLFHGRCEGHIAAIPSGRGGFGYDPLFVPNGYTLSFAELGEEAKNRISHRSQALAALQKWFVDKR